MNAHGIVFHGRPLPVLDQFYMALVFYRTYHRGLSYVICIWVRIVVTYSFKGERV